MVAPSLPKKCGSGMWRAGAKWAVGATLLGAGLEQPPSLRRTIHRPPLKSAPSFPFASSVTRSLLPPSPSEYVVPQEYVQTMRAAMLERCPISSYDQLHSVFTKELGHPPENVFAEFGPVPLASASLAQVHAAKAHDGRKVAVKVQHIHLTDTAVADIVTVDFLVNFSHRRFPAFDYRWLVDEVRESAPKEGVVLHRLELASCRTFSCV